MKRKTRMYEPWGYRDENNYESSEIILENDLESFFSGVNYNKDDNKIHFQNKDGEEVASLDVNEFVKSDSIIDHTEYADGILKIFFTNGDVVTIDLTELLDENEFKDGLIVDDHVVKVLIDGESDSKYVSVSENGVKVAGIEADIETEKARAEGEEQRIETKLDDEIARATSAETALDAKIDQEITDRTADVDEEETRATEEETTIKNTIGGGFSTASTETVTAKFNDLSNALTTEINNRTTQDNQLQNNINTESTARQAADTRLENIITDERNRATAEEQRIDEKLDRETSDRIADVNEEETRAKAAEETLQGAIDDEKTRAEAAEQALGDKINQEIADRIADVNAEEARAYSAETELAEGIEILGSVKFDEVVYDSSAKAITFYAEGNAKGEIDTTDFVKDGMIDNVEIKDGNLVITFNTESGKHPIEIPLTDIFNPENYYDKNAIDGIVSDLEAADGVISGAVDNVSADLATEAQRAFSAETDLQAAIDLKADKETTYTQEEVDALIKAKETEIYNLTKIVGDMGGNVVYNYPNDLGTSLTTLLSNNGTVKLGEDATITRFGPGIFAKNKVKLNLNNHNLTSTSAGDYGAIMTRGTQEITIYGKGTIDAGGGICIEANSKDSIINLTGSTTIYENDRSGGELIYCYDGTINITNGTFRNNGDDKKFLLNCYDANRAAGTAKIIVTGGKFYDFDPMHNTAEGPDTNFLAPGYHTEPSTVVEEGVEHTVYTVKKDA